jgi:hypothetical protein
MTIVEGFRSEAHACGRVQDELPCHHGRGQGKRETVVITKHGQPVAKLVPVNTGQDEIFGFYSGRGSVNGDVVSPALSDKEWGNLK